MKKYIAALALLTLSVFPPDLLAEDTEFPDISIEELEKVIAKGDVILLDVNGSRYFAKGHIPGAIDYHVVEANLAEALGEDKTKLIVVYCGSPTCEAYLTPAEAVRKLGYRNIRHLSAGISGWIGAGKPTGRVE